VSLMTRDRWSVDRALTASCVCSLRGGVSLSHLVSTLHVTPEEVRDVVRALSQLPEVEGTEGTEGFALGVKVGKAFKALFPTPKQARALERPWKRR
jgi:hypothetical protein